MVNSIMKPAHNNVKMKFTVYDAIAAIIIIAHFSILVVGRGGLPTGWDTPYHLLMGKMYADYGRVTLWDYYEYAPVGRPQVYPPLLHVIIWWAHSLTGMDYIAIGRVFAVVQFPLALLSIYYFVRRIYGCPEALYSLLTLSSISMFWMWEVTVAPTAVLVILYPAFLYYFYKKSLAPSVLIMASAFYMHLGMPFIFVASAVTLSILAAAKRVSYWGFLAKCLGLSLLAYLPWLVHVLRNLEYIHGRMLARGVQVILWGFVSGNIVYITLTFAGLAVSVLEYKRGVLKYSVAIAGFLGFLPAFAYGPRYFLHSPVANSILAGIAAAWAIRKIHQKFNGWHGKALASAIILIVAFQSVCEPSIGLRGRWPPRGPGQPGWHGCQSPLMSEIMMARGTALSDPWMFSCSDPDLVALSNWIIENIPEDEILHVPMGAVATYITLTTGRLTDSGMYGEVRTEEMMAEIQKGRKSGIFVLKPYGPGGRRILTVYPGKELFRSGQYAVIEIYRPEHANLTLLKGKVKIGWISTAGKPEDLENAKLLLEQLNYKSVTVIVPQDKINKRSLLTLSELFQGYSLAVEIIVMDWSTLQDALNQVKASGIAEAILLISQDTPPPADPMQVRQLVGSIGIEVYYSIIGPPLTSPEWDRPVLESLLQGENVILHIPAVPVLADILEADMQILGEWGCSVKVQVDIVKDRPLREDVIANALSQASAFHVEIGVGVPGDLLYQALDMLSILLG